MKKKRISFYRWLIVFRRAEGHAAIRKMAMKRMFLAANSFRHWAIIFYLGREEYCDVPTFSWACFRNMCRSAKGFREWCHVYKSIASVDQRRCYAEMRREAFANMNYLARSREDVAEVNRLFLDCHNWIIDGI